VTGPQSNASPSQATWKANLRFIIATHFFLTNDIVEFLERFLVAHGSYHLASRELGDPFDMETSAWTYRKVNESDPFPGGFAPLGVEGGIAKEIEKMNRLWQQLQERNIAISVVVYPYPSQVVHETAESRQVRIWRDWCLGKCKRFVSLFPAFLAVKEHCPWTESGCWYQSLFVFGDIHYSDAGNALVADKVIQSLTREPPAKRFGERPLPESNLAIGAH